MAFMLLSFYRAPLGFLLFLFLTSFRFAMGGNLLVIPQDGSHWLSMQAVVEELHQRGHKIVMVIPEVTIHIRPSQHYTVRTYPVPYSKEYLELRVKELRFNIFAEEPFLQKVFTMYKRISNFSRFMFSACKHFLLENEMIQTLNESKFDAIFIDPTFPCEEIVAEYLSLPSVYFLRGIPCAIEYEVSQCPSPPSYVPRIFTSYTDHMTFPQRVKNLLVNHLNPLLCSILYSQYGNLASEFLQRDVTDPTGRQTSRVSMDG
ncbi:UDP-glucuronosyltransferase 1-1-like [Microcaecilia unicolor]|uniref:glucuronosyltransferase n=1 Tax=Microcaecilia unicolor TaxID=1415580 RepID=A0A6P7YGW5_9AMPH|nr:UDP-glucuronosyltransferase 1-1-like [Microcaecilia unicolor]